MDVTAYRAVTTVVPALDCERLTFRHGGRDERLTDLHQVRIVRQVLA